VIHRVDRRLVGERAEHPAPDVAWKHLRGQEDDDAEHKQRHQAEREAFCEKAGDGGAPPAP
jgi:hypothetical protein